MLRVNSCPVGRTNSTARHRFWIRQNVKNRLLMVAHSQTAAESLLLAGAIYGLDNPVKYVYVLVINTHVRTCEYTASSDN
jgi:hypothetical protein